MYLTQTPEFKRGDTLLLNFEYTDSDTNLPLDLTGCAFRLYIKNVRTGELAVAATTANDLLQVDPELGRIRLNVPPHLTVDFIPGRHMYDIEMTDTSGAVFSSETNYIEIIQDVTV